MVAEEEGARGTERTRTAPTRRSTRSAGEDTGPSVPCTGSEYHHCTAGSSPPPPLPRCVDGATFSASARLAGAHAAMDAFQTSSFGLRPSIAMRCVSAALLSGSEIFPPLS